jgi:hypothetical protein
MNQMYLILGCVALVVIVAAYFWMTSEKKQTNQPVEVTASIKKEEEKKAEKKEEKKIEPVNVSDADFNGTFALLGTGSFLIVANNKVTQRSQRGDAGASQSFNIKDTNNMFELIKNKFYKVYEVEFPGKVSYIVNTGSVIVILAKDKNNDYVEDAAPVAYKIDSNTDPNIEVNKLDTLAKAFQTDMGIERSPFVFSLLKKNIQSQVESKFTDLPKEGLKTLENGTYLIMGDSKDIGVGYIVVENNKVSVVIPPSGRDPEPKQEGGKFIFDKEATVDGLKFYVFKDEKDPKVLVSNLTKDFIAILSEASGSYQFRQSAYKLSSSTDSSLKGINKAVKEYLGENQSTFETNMNFFQPGARGKGRQGKGQSDIATGGDIILADGTYSLVNAGNEKFFYIIDNSGSKITFINPPEGGRNTLIVETQLGKRKDRYPFADNKIKMDLPIYSFMIKVDDRMREQLFAVMSQDILLPLVLENGKPVQYKTNAMMVRVSKSTNTSYDAVSQAAKNYKP